MFSSCFSLTTIIVSNDFVTTQVTDSVAMFGNCDDLTGSQGTTIASVSYVDDKTYAKIDGGTGDPGLFSEILTPTPTPTPYNPGGSGGNSRGGSDSTSPYSHDEVTLQVTRINQLKYIKSAVDSRQVTWVYEPTTNKFKMNINVGNQSIPASDGFYLVSKNVEQDVNGTKVQVPTTATYYFDREGNMVTGWVNTVDNKWYYLENVKTAREGMMVFGWYQVQNKWYYFLADGTMLTNNITPDGFVVGADGAWVQ